MDAWVDGGSLCMEAIVLASTLPKVSQKRFLFQIKVKLLLIPVAHGHLLA
jgi:hypothetical protein